MSDWNREQGAGERVQRSWEQNGPDAAMLRARADALEAELARMRGRAEGAEAALLEERAATAALEADAAAMRRALGSLVKSVEVYDDLPSTTLVNELYIEVGDLRRGRAALASDAGSALLARLVDAERDLAAARATAASLDAQLADRRAWEAEAAEAVVRCRAAIIERAVDRYGELVCPYCDAPDTPDGIDHGEDCKVAAALAAIDALKLEAIPRPDAAAKKEASNGR